MEDKNKPEKYQVLTPREHEIKQDVDNFIDRVPDNLLPYHKTWYLNIAFFQGFQWANYNNATRMLEIQGVPKYRIRAVRNKIIGPTLNSISKITRSKPQLYAIPDSHEQKDRDAAECANSVIDHYWYKTQMPIKVIDLTTTYELFGSAFLRPYWNPAAGVSRRVYYDIYGEAHFSKDEFKSDLLDDSESNKAIPWIDEETGDIKSDVIEVGDLENEVLNPFEVVVDPSLKEDAIQEMAIVKIRPLAWIRKRYPKTGKMVGDEKNADYSTHYEWMLKGLVSANPGVHRSSHSDTTELDGYVRHYEYYKLPCEEYPNGLTVHYANGVILEYGDLPFEYCIEKRRFPIVKFDSLRLPTRYFGMSRIENARAPQREYNKLTSDELEYLRLTLRPKLLVPKGAGISQESFTTEPGELIAYHPNFGAPSVLNPPGLPKEHDNAKQQAIQDIMDVFSYHEVSNAQVPSSDPSGRLIALLQEQDDTKLGPTIRANECRWEEWGELTLAILREKVQEPRLIHIVGEGRAIQVKEFLGADLAGATSVRAEVGSTLPNSRIAMQEFILRLVREGIMRPDEARQKLEFGKTEMRKFIQNVLLDESAALRENDQLKDGQYIDPRPYEDHMIHLKVLHNAMKASEFRSYPEEVQQLYYQHEKAHQMFLVQEQQAAMPAGAGPPGGPGGKSAPPAHNMGHNPSPPPPPAPGGFNEGDFQDTFAKRDEPMG